MMDPLNSGRCHRSNFVKRCATLEVGDHLPARLG
jgi:hypothetical protein